MLGNTFPFSYQNRIWEEALRRNYEKVLNLYEEVSGHREPAFVRNFGVKLLYWIEFYFPQLFLETMKMRSFPKFVCGGTVKLQEYLFLYLLVLMGCDVLYLNPEQDVLVDSEILLRLSSLCELGPKRRIVIPAVFDSGMREKLLGTGNASKGKIVISRDYVRRPEKRRETAENTIVCGTPRQPEAAANVTGTPGASGGGAGTSGSSGGSTGVRMSIPPRPGRSAQPGGGQTGSSRPSVPPIISNGGSSGNQSGYGLADGQPLDYVELAKRASSVVMIGVYNKNKECYKTGSGAIISDRGFILTNFHVACDAAYYGIRLEEEEHIFFTDELVKYNQYHDLAILRVDRPRAPIPIYRGKQELVRGQKVVAIGSPLGLFNTVSDGIISGFRKMEDVSMIQFTAPTSHGSSGGALLDLYGNLIGVITAGYDDGQNLNLAVDYKTVWTFAQGFVQK